MQMVWATWYFEFYSYMCKNQISACATEDEDKNDKDKTSSWLQDREVTPK